MRVTTPHYFLQPLGLEIAYRDIFGRFFGGSSTAIVITALITAVNHSGLSAAVGALTGAIMGAGLGAEALPEFYLESLSPAQALSELAKDLAQGALTSGLFDDDWDHKYMQGLPPEALQ